MLTIVHNTTKNIAFAPHVDLEKVGSVLENLLENGIRYADRAKEKGRVIVSF